jgi:hypothetical protein
VNRRIACIGVAVATLLSGCSNPPDPVTSTPAFDTEQQAFAAAEQTYRNYVDALNQVDLSDPATFEEVYRWTTGDANAGARKTFSQMHADGWTVTGRNEFDGFTATEFSASDSASRVVARVCLDVTDVLVIDADGESRVPIDRVNRRPAVVTFAVEGTATGLAITTSQAVTGSACE